MPLKKDPDVYTQHDLMQLFCLTPKEISKLPLLKTRYNPMNPGRPIKTWDKAEIDRIFGGNPKIALAERSEEAILYDHIFARVKLPPIGTMELRDKVVAEHELYERIVMKALPDYTPVMITAETVHRWMVDYLLEHTVLRDVSNPSPTDGREEELRFLVKHVALEKIKKAYPVLTDVCIEIDSNF